jgi:hypothetical protein
MCGGISNPTGFLGTSTLIAQGIGTVGESFGAAMSASAEASSQRLQAYFARLNAETEMDNAREALRQGQFAEQRQRLETANLKSRQRAAMGANNVDMSEGSALDRQVSTDYIGETDANTIAANAQRDAAGSRTRATSYRMDARMRTAAARSISPFTTGLTTLATGATRVAGDWYRMNQTGVFSNGSTGSGSTNAPRSTFDLPASAFSDYPPVRYSQNYQRIGP